MHRPQTNTFFCAFAGVMSVWVLVCGREASSLFVWLPFEGGHREVCERQAGLLASKQT